MYVANCIATSLKKGYSESRRKRRPNCANCATHSLIEDLHCKTHVRRNKQKKISK